MSAPDYSVQSLARAASVLGAFSVERPQLTIGEIAQRIALPRSTVHRLVVNLVRLGFLARDPRTERYRLGLLVVELGTIALSGFDLREKAQPIMEQLANETGEALFLAVLDHGSSAYIAKVDGRYGLRMTAQIGRRAPLHCTATGKTLLAYLPEDAVRRIALETGLARRTARTIVDVEALLVELARIRARGYTIDDGESEDGLVGIAAPVRGATGDVIAALVIAGPSPRLAPERRGEIAGRVVGAADAISRAVGFQPSTPAAPRKRIVAGAHA